MKTILVPTDFSANASNALNFAILLAQKINARLVLFNAFQVPVPVAEVSYNVMEELLEGKKNEISNKLLSECEKVRHAGGVAYEYYVKEGEVLDSVLDLSKHYHFDYIIMGTKGRGKNITSIFGSTTSRLMAKTNITVIAVPEKAHFPENLRKITFATDYIIADVDAIAKLTKLASAFNAQVNVLHISKNSVAAVDQTRLMKEFMAKVNAETDYNNISFQVMADEDPEKRLEEYINEHNADMIVMSTHMRNVLERIFSGGLTKHIALNTQIPLVVFHHQHKDADVKLSV